MRFTQKFCAQHLGWTFKKHWNAQRKKVPRDTGAAAELKRVGFFIKDIYGMPQFQTRFLTEKLSDNKPKSMEEGGTLSDWQFKPCHVFGNNDILLGGMEQALLLTKSIEICSLPESIRDSIKSVALTPILERNVKEAIMSSRLFCTDQVKLSKERFQLRPEFNLPREYGSLHARKISILVNKLLQECDKYASRITNSQRYLLDQVHLRVTVPKNDNLLQYSAHAQKVIMSQRPIEAIKKSYDSKLPVMHPINYTISMRKQHIYTLETIYRKTFNVLHRTFSARES